MNAPFTRRSGVADQTAGTVLDDRIRREGEYIMTSNHLLMAIAAAAVLASGPALAARDHTHSDQTSQRTMRGDCGTDARGDHRADRGHHAHDRHEARAAKVLQVVPNGSLPDQPSYGWQYFSNQRTKVAVVISPAGEYYLSRGDGPRQITGPAGEALTVSQARD